VKPDRYDLGSLPVFTKEEFRRQVESFDDPVAVEDEELARDVRAALLDNLDRIE
jgi:hypothetical protein